MNGRVVEMRLNFTFWNPVVVWHIHYSWVYSLPKSVTLKLRVKACRLHAGLFLFSHSLKLICMNLYLFWKVLWLLNEYCICGENLETSQLLELNPFIQCHFLKINLSHHLVFQYHVINVISFSKTDFTSKAHIIKYFTIIHTLQIYLFN